MKESRTDEEIKNLQEKRKEEKKRLKEEKRKELAEADKRRKHLSEAAEEAAIKLGRKKSSFNPYYLMFGGLFVALIYIIIMLFMNRQTPLNKIPVIDEVKFFEHNSASSWKQGPCKFWEGQTLADAKRLMSRSFA